MGNYLRGAWQRLPARTFRPRFVSRGRPTPLGYLQEKGYSALIKIAFQCMTLMCDGLSALSPEHLRLCISTLGQFGRQADTNIALTAAEILFWGVSDAIQAKRREADHEPAHSAPWMHLLLEILCLCADARPEVRMGAIQTFRTLQPYGATLSLDTWGECVWKVTFSIRGVPSAPRRCAVSSVRSRVLRPPCRLLKASGRLWWRFGKRRGLSARRWAQW